jgi:hypothetical protein
MNPQAGWAIHALRLENGFSHRGRMFQCDVTY